MDQSLAIIIASAIAIGGTLGGVYISNFNNTKSEKRKSDTAIVEEIYQTLIKVDGLCDELVYAMKHSQKADLDEAVERRKEIRSTSDKVRALIRLHLPKLKQELEKYVNSLGDYCNSATFIKFGKAGQPINKTELNTEFEQAHSEYKQSLETLQTKLEGLMEKVAL